MATGYRRRILIEPADGHVTAELEDDYHRMVVTLHHDGATIRAVESAMKRSPWTLCPGAIAQLAATFTGVALAAAAKRGDKSSNCTHLYDLATWGAAHAGGDSAVTYEVLATDTVEGVRGATLWRNGARLFDWTLAGERFVAPDELAGQTLFGINAWIAAQAPDLREAARVLRWAAIVGMGRGMDIPAGIPATRFPMGACFNFQPGRAEASFRREGADVDFSVEGRAPMADRAAFF